MFIGLLKGTRKLENKLIQQRKQEEQNGHSILLLFRKLFKYAKKTITGAKKYITFSRRKDLPFHNGKFNEFLTNKD